MTLSMLINVSAVTLLAKSVVPADMVNCGHDVLTFHLVSRTI